MPRCACAAQRRYGTAQARELFKNTWEKQPDLAPNVVEYTKFFDRVRRSSRRTRRHSIIFLPQVALLVAPELHGRRSHLRWIVPNARLPAEQDVGHAGQQQSRALQ